MALEELAPAALPEGFYRSVLDQAQDAIAVIMYQPTKRYVYVNEAQCRLTGYPREAWYSTPELAGRIVHPDDLPHVARMRDVEGEPILLRIVRKDGEIRWTESRSHPIRDERGEVIALQSINRDVTERVLAQDALRRSEERYRAAVATMLDAFSIYRAVRNDAGEIVDFELDFANEAACAALGLPRERVLGRRMGELYPGSTSAPMFRAYAEVVETGKPLARDGERGPSGRVYDVRASRIADDRFGVAWRDVTDRVRAEDERRRATVTKALVQGLVHAVAKELPHSHALRRSVGQSLARRAGQIEPQDVAACFEDLGMGTLQLLSASEGRYVFEGRDLIDREEVAMTATCFTTLGFLEGALGGAASGSALGTETSCQSLGHRACRFVVVVRG